jgi:hypothetical protein
MGGWAAKQKSRRAEEQTRRTGEYERTGTGFRKADILRSG